MDPAPFFLTYACAAPCRRIAAASASDLRERRYPTYHRNGATTTDTGTAPTPDAILADTAPAPVAANPIATLAPIMLIGAATMLPVPFVSRARPSLPARCAPPYFLAATRAKAPHTARSFEPSWKDVAASTKSRKRVEGGDLFVFGAFLLQTPFLPVQQPGAQCAQTIEVADGRAHDGQRVAISIRVVIRFIVPTTLPASSVGSLREPRQTSRNHLSSAWGMWSNKWSLFGTSWTFVRSAFSSSNSLLISSAARRFAFSGPACCARSASSLSISSERY